MNTEELTKLENYCKLLYGGSNPSILEKLEATRSMLQLQSSVQYLPQLQYTLENSQSQYALLFAAKSISIVLTKDWRNVSQQQRLQLQRFLLQLLAKHENPSNFVTKSIMHGLCRVTKLGWCSDPQLRGLMDEIVQFLTAGVPHAVLGLRLLSELITEFETGRVGLSGRLDPEGRLVAQAFREQDGLSRAFLLALDTVNRAFSSDNPTRDRPVLKAALSTLQTCLAYDFVGTGFNETDDMVACMYIPMQWTKHIANANAVRLLFQIYQSQWQVANESEIDGSEDSAGSMCLQCIALLAATRRSVFDEKSRREFLVALLEGSTLLMKEKVGLSHSEACLHHLCRLLARLKSHFQLVELAKPPQYHDWLQALANFTEEVLNAWRSVSTRSIHYLVRLWGALVLPTPYLRMRDGLSRSYDNSNPGNPAAGGNSAPNSAPNYLRGLDTYVPRVVQSFIATRAAMCSAAAVEELDVSGGAGQSNAEGQGFGNFGQGSGGIEDNPLDDEGMLLEQLAPLATLVRFRYSVSAQSIADLFMNAIQNRQRAVQLLTSGGGQQQINEGKRSLSEAQACLAFLTYVVGAVVGGHVTRVSARAIDRLEELNSELAALVFKMVTDSQRTEEIMANAGESPAAFIFGFGSNAGWRLELATLYFFRCFQSIYIESRAREDQSNRPARSRPVELVEDVAGFMNFAFLRRGAIGSGGDSGGSSTPEPTVNSSMAMVVTGQKDSNDRSMLPFIQVRSLPAASPSLDVLNRGGANTVQQPQQQQMDQTDSKGSTPCPSPLVVDELSAAELMKKEKQINEEATARAAAMQRSIAARVGVDGGDRALLDIAMRRIFGLLQYAQMSNDTNQGTKANGGAHSEQTSAPVVLVQRALSVLYQLSVGVTIVHPGRVNPPRLMSSGRLLLESEVILDLLQNPNPERFPFLREPKHGRARSFLMATLAKLLFTLIRFPSNQNHGQVPESMFDVNANTLTPQGQVEERFVKFMQSITEVADGLLQLAQGNQMDLRLPALKSPTIGLLRDLRGVISSATAAREYELIYSWFYPRRLGLLSILASVWNDSFDVIIPLLKLLAELVHNRGSRILFPHLSAGGLILFREASKVLVAFCKPQLQALERTKELQKSRHEQREVLKKNLRNYNSNISQSISQALGAENQDPMSMQALQEAVAAMGEELNSSSTSSPGGGDEARASMHSVVALGQNCVGPGVTVDLDSSQQKCSRVCMVTLQRLLNGRFAPLGVFELFGDTCLVDSRRVVLELAFSSSPNHTMSFNKMAKVLISLLHLISEKFVISLVDVSSALFGRIIGCLGEALYSSQSNISTPAAAIIEAIVSFRCKAVANAAPGDESGGVRAVLNPEHRSRGDTTSQETYKKAAQLFAMHEQANPELFASLLGIHMHLLLNSPSLESNNQWTFAKAVMPLIFSAPAEFEKQRANFLSAQSPAKEPRIREAFDSIFSKLGPALSDVRLMPSCLRSNDVFSKALCSFCRDLRRSE